MGRKQSNEELQTRVKYLDAQNSLLNIFLHDTVTEARPDCAVQVPEGNTETVYKGVLYRADSASGGYVILTREWKGQSASSVHYLDDLNDKRWPLEVRIVAERLTTARYKLLALPVREKERIST